MSTLAAYIIGSRSFPFSGSLNMRDSGKRFFGILINDRAMRKILFILLSAGIASYLISLYAMFGLGVQMEKKSMELEGLRGQQRILELNIQEQETAFARQYADILQSTMEKISEIRYLSADTVAVSQAGLLNNGLK